MKIGFLQTARHSINETISNERLEKLPEVISKQTDFNYLYESKDNGCVLKPTFRKMPYRNSFVPEIDIEITENSEQTCLEIKGQPAKFVRIFMTIWCVTLLIMSVVFIALVLVSQFDRISVIIPLCMCAYGYFLCEFGTKITFRSIVNVIRQELK